MTKTAGKFKVGHKLIFNPKFKNPISVFYPADNIKGLKKKKWLNYNSKVYMDALNKFNKICKVFEISWLNQIETHSYEQAELSTSISSLVPIIYSHEAGGSRAHYQVLAQNLAS